MKNKVDHTHKTTVEFDKRDLVNLDLYENEISIILNKLRLIRKGVQPTKHQAFIDDIKRELSNHARRLKTFRRNYDVEEDVLQKRLKRSHKNENALNVSHTENFFQHLNVFESRFNDTRQKAHALINQYAF